MRFTGLLLIALLAALAAGCGSDGKKGEMKNQDRPRRGDSEKKS